MPSRIDIADFLNQDNNACIIDVRSEAEYEQAHIPCAVNIPLLHNESRKIVGTIYKQEGHEAAVKAGYDLVGKNFGALYEKYKAVSNGQNVIFYCWRGGMRSNISATLFEWGGHKAQVIAGGYKIYRKSVLAGFSEVKKLCILSGFTGVGKTEILALLAKNNQQIIDLEALAKHKGSVLGGLGMPSQNSQEMFENNLFHHWRKLKSNEVVFIENESRKIGSNLIPLGIWEQMNNAAVIEIAVDRETRLKRILSEYGIHSTIDLKVCTEKIKKRLGGLNLKMAIDALNDGNLLDWASVLMDYYDRTYEHGRNKEVLNTQEFNWDWNQPQTALLSLMRLVNP